MPREEPAYAHISEERWEELEELAEYASKDYQIPLPRVGTPAFKRLIDTALHYADRVHYQATSPMMNIDERRRQGSDKVRRKFHNDLCLMIFGKMHSECSKQELNRISNFAVSVAGMGEYIDTF